jgi:hypothetical protein
MKASIVGLALLAAVAACAHGGRGAVVLATNSGGVDFTFFPPHEGIESYIPLSSKGACGAKGVFAEDLFGVVVDEVMVDGRAAPSSTSPGNWDSVAPPLVVRPDTGFTFLVSPRRLGAHFFDWADKVQSTEFVPPMGGMFRGTQFEIDFNAGKPEELVIRYRVRCTDMTLSPPIVAHGRNAFVLAKESQARWSRRTSR